ncbi:MAG: CHAD domain-containing protein [Deltaproteobacteria bacterium]|nr:CHAD domain-containing protein [Deltaproteobacteria bacterium]
MAADDPFRRPTAPARDSATAVRRIAVRMLGDLGAARRRVQGGGDVEALHDYRVSLRRARTLTRALGPLLLSAEAPKLAKVLGRIARATGGSRDLEVLARRLEAAPADPVVADVLHAEIRRQRRRADAELRRALRLEVHTQVVGLFEAVFRPDGFLEQGDAPLVVTARARILPCVDRAISSVDAATGADGDLAQLHEARITLKRVRYLLEAFSDALPPMRRPRATLSRLQDALGLVHDLDVHAQWVARAALRAERRRMRDLAGKLELLDAVAVNAFLSCFRPEDALIRGVERLTAWMSERREEAAKRSLRDLEARGHRALAAVRAWLVPAAAPAPRGRSLRALPRAPAA